MKKYALLLCVFLVIIPWARLFADPSGLYQHLPEFPPLPGDPQSATGQAVPLDSHTIFYLLTGAVILFKTVLPSTRKKKQ